MQVLARLSTMSRGDQELQLVDIYRRHRDFVWLTLQRMGVRSSDVEDAFQEVFVVASRRFHEFEGRADIRTWLFQVSARVVANYRKRAHRRHEELVYDPPEPAHDESTSTSPEAAMSTRQEKARLEAILNQLDPEKRAVLVMYELEETSGEDIAATLGIPIPTVYSRLRLARAAFEKAARRMLATEPKGRLG